MDEEYFIAFMKRDKKSLNTIKGYVNSVKIYEKYLQVHKQGINPDEATPSDLKDYVLWGMEELDNVYRTLWGIRTYYWSIESDEMANTAREWMAFVQNETRRLSEFPKVDRDAVTKLKKNGISTVNQLLDIGRTYEDREELANKIGVPQESILELVKLSNLSRLPGAKKVRGRLFYEAGLDTLSKIAALNPEEFQKILQDYVEKTGFDGSPPNISEAESTVTMARFLPEIVEF